MYTASKTDSISSITSRAILPSASAYGGGSGGARQWHHRGRGQRPSGGFYVNIEELVSIV
jgi:hypothetical protein